MKLREDPPVDLTYCLNVHPGETLREIVEALRGPVKQVRDMVARGGPFGLGLRLGAQAVRELLEGDALSRFQALLAENGFYVFTLNGFPYGEFHGGAVKENVYKPDWGTRERLDYTRNLVEILAALLPEGSAGSISTVPGSYKTWVQDPAGAELIARNLSECAFHCLQAEESRGRIVRIGLEPEPDCYLESAGDSVEFFRKVLIPIGSQHLKRRYGIVESRAEEILRSYLGICLDTCHEAVLFTDPAASLSLLAGSGIEVVKIQLSAALEAEDTEAARRALVSFRDEVYLHQVKLRTAAPAVLSFPDLDPFLRTEPSGGTFRVHFHIPLYAEPEPPLRSTSHALSGDFFQAVLSRPQVHLEIETYTFGVLPSSLRTCPLPESIAKEYRWVLGRLEPRLRL